MRKIIRVGTRTSRLALWQTGYVIDRLKENCPGTKYRIVPIVTKGDRFLDVSWDKIGDKGFFTKELEVALLGREIDIAVHSMKDFPTGETPGLTIAAVTSRHDPREVLLSRRQETFFQLPPQSRVGTSSLRRKAQLLYGRPDLDLVDLRGNVDTRVRKLLAGEFDAIVLAAAGVERLGLQEHITEKLDFSLCLPAAGQGALGVQVRDDASGIPELVRTLNDPVTEKCVRAERALLTALGGGCRAPVGAFARAEGNKLSLEGMVGTPDGRFILRESISGEEDPREIAEMLAKRLIARGAAKILSEIRQEHV